MKRPRMTRRSMLIMATACAATAGSIPSAWSRHEWHGTALGADGHLIFDGLDRPTADRMARLAIAEIDRLEQVFSLYRVDSQLSRLNREGCLEHPSHDLQKVLGAALGFWRNSKGAFNPAIQPVWRFLAGHFSNPLERGDPDPDKITALLRLCNPAEIVLDDQKISLKPGMALTLNGIAQGYITDQVVSLFHSQGLRNILVQLGEIRALPGRAWDIGIEGSDRTLRLRDGAIASSAGTGTRFTPDTRWHHLIDPLSGRSGRDFVNVSVQAPTAMMADALSTAIAVGNKANAIGVMHNHPHAAMFAQHADGRAMKIIGRSFPSSFS